MGTLTTRPTATVAQGTWARTGGTTVHGVESDNSDATYMESTSIGSAMRLTFGNPAIPAGAAVIGVVARFRKRRTGSGWSCRVRFQPLPNVLPSSEQVDYYLSGSTVATDAIGGWIISSIPATRDLSMWKQSEVGLANARIHELYYDWLYVAKPTVAVDAPTGTLTEESTPDVTWTPTLDPDGGDQAKYRVKVFTDAQYLAGGFDPETSAAFEDSGIIDGSAASWTPSTAQPDDTYRAYVKVAQSLVTGVTHWSDWAFSGYTISTPIPAVPTLALTSEPALGRIKAEVTGQAGAATTDAVQAQRLLPGGDWEDLRTAEGGGLISGTSGTFYDYEVPNGTTATYRARAVHHYTAGDAFSAWSATADSSWTSSDQWLKHPTAPALNMKVAFHSQPGYTREARQAVIQPVGRPDAIVISDTRSPPSGEIAFRLDTDAEVDALTAILDRAAPLLLQAPAGQGWPDRWVAFSSHAQDRFIDKSWPDGGIASLGWIEVTRPVGDLE